MNNTLIKDGLSISKSLRRKQLYKEQLLMGKPVYADSLCEKMAPFPAKPITV